jgi:hypothetical protein
MRESCSLSATVTDNDDLSRFHEFFDGIFIDKINHLCVEHGGACSDSNWLTSPRLSAMAMPSKG